MRNCIYSIIMSNPLVKLFEVVHVVGSSMFKKSEGRRHILEYEERHYVCLYNAGIWFC